jgi:hypothetical protein
MAAGVTKPALQFHNKTNAGEGVWVSRPRRREAGLSPKKKHE